MKAVLCWVDFFPEKRPGIKPLSDFLKHVSYGNSPYFCALAALPSRSLGETRGRSVEGSGFRVHGFRGLGFRV